MASWCYNSCVAAVGQEDLCCLPPCAEQKVTAPHREPVGLADTIAPSQALPDTSITMVVIAPCCCVPLGVWLVLMSVLVLMLKLVPVGWQNRQGCPPQHTCLAPSAVVCAWLQPCLLSPCLPWRRNTPSRPRGGSGEPQGTGPTVYQH